MPAADRGPAAVHAAFKTGEGRTNNPPGHAYALAGRDHGGKPRPHARGTCRRRSRQEPERHDRDQESQDHASTVRGAE